MKKNQIDIQLVVEHEGLIPHYASAGAAGADVKAHIKESIVISPGASALVPTGLKAVIPEGYEIQVRPRSGLALKHQITVLNTPGTIDSDYRGEICVILINHGRTDFIVEPGMRIAQFIVATVTKGHFFSVQEDELIQTSRGKGGFGHTGIH